MIRRLWREFSAEIVALCLAGIGTFLLLERMQIRATFVRILGSLLAALASVGRAIVQGLRYEATHVTLSDAIGLMVIALAIWIVVWRVRWRMARSEHLASRVCPECGSRLDRVHRRTGDRLFTWIVPLRRYRCANHDCRWTGLRSRLRRFAEEEAHASTASDASGDT